MTARISGRDLDEDFHSRAVSMSLATVGVRTGNAAGMRLFPAWTLRMVSSSSLRTMFFNR